MSSAPQPYPDVLILGAGFSKAPVRDDAAHRRLGNGLISELRERVPDQGVPDRFHGGQFEAWPSRLAEEQPDLSTTENLANQHLFALCSQLLAGRLEEHVAEAWTDPDAQLQDHDDCWLPTLLGTLHARQATVVTFNQDVLVEMAVRAAGLRCWDAALIGDRSTARGAQWTAIPVDAAEVPGGVTTSAAERDPADPRNRPMKPLNDPARPNPQQTRTALFEREPEPEAKP